MKFGKCLQILSAVLLLQFGLFGQSEDLFEDSFVHEIRIYFEQDNFWEDLTFDYDSSYPDIPYTLANVIIDGQQIDSVGVRIKGFSSYFGSTVKKSLKLDFNEFVPGKNYQGIKKVNLNNGEGDPSIQRDIISYDLFNRIGINAPRTAYTRVFLNDNFWGLYLIVEQINKDFLEESFGNSDGNLFKNMQNSDLSWLSQEASLYQEIFELKTDDNPDAWENFVDFVDILNNSTDNNFKEDFSKVFDVDRYLKVLMVDVAITNWDSYIEHGRNFYLYQNPNSQKFQWIPWDYNLSMGGNFSGIGEFETPDISECLTILNGTCPYPVDDEVAATVMSINPTCCEVEWSSECQEIYDEISPTPPEECETILNGSCPYPPTDSIFIEVIGFDSFCCTNDWDDVCQSLYDDLESGESPGFFGFSFPIDMSESEKVLINRLLSVEEYKEDYYNHWCKFLKFDYTIDRIFPEIEERGDLIREYIEQDSNNMWSLDQFESDLDQGSLFIPGLKKYLAEQIPALQSELSELYTCPNINSTFQFNDIVINEFCASCDSLYQQADANGEYEDWIELYNNTLETIDLSDAYLTDKIGQARKWSFPSGTEIGPESYLIVWADNDEGQEGLHTNFKLNKAGEAIMLSIGETVLDSISFTEQTSNITKARIPNGIGDFTSTAVNTFGGNNDEPLSGNDDYADGFEIAIWPNPAKEQVHLNLVGASKSNLLNKDLEIIVIDPLGREISRNKLNEIQHTINIGMLTNGMYGVQILDLQGKLVATKRFMKL